MITSLKCHVYSLMYKVQPWTATCLCSCLKAKLDCTHTDGKCNDTNQLQLWWHTKWEILKHLLLLLLFAIHVMAYFNKRLLSKNICFTFIEISTQIEPINRPGAGLVEQLGGYESVDTKHVIVPQVMLQIESWKFTSKKAPVLLKKVHSFFKRPPTQAPFVVKAVQCIQPRKQYKSQGKSCTWITVNETIDTFYLREQSEGEGHNLVSSARKGSQTTHYGRKI